MEYFNISWHSTKDGPGTRTVVFLQGCNLRCEWCHSPHSHLAKSPVLFFGEYCQQCGACVKACHNEALTMYRFQLSPENLHFLARHSPENIIVRTPLIYPCTSKLENINGICKLMKENKVRTIELLKYNPYTSLYYNALGKPFYEQGYRAVYDSEWNEILDLFQKNEMNATYLT